MLGRPNLARLNCRNFRFGFQISLSLDPAKDFIQQTTDIDEGHEHLFAVFGNLYRSGGKNFVADAFIHEVEDDKKDGLNEFHAIFILSQEERPPPPKELVTTQKLASFLLEYGSDAQVECNCTAVFRYNPVEGWESDIDLPEELSDAWEDVPYTHIDSIRMSQRTEEGIEQWIQVTVRADGVIEHQIQFKRTESLSNRLAQNLLRYASKQSQDFVFQNEIQEK